MRTFAVCRSRFPLACVEVAARKPSKPANAFFNVSINCIVTFCAIWLFFSSGSLRSIEASTTKHQEQEMVLLLCFFFFFGWKMGISQCAGNDEFKMSLEYNFLFGGNRLKWRFRISFFSSRLARVFVPAQVANGAVTPEKWVNSDSIPSIVAFHRRHERAAHRVLWARCDFPLDVCDRHKTVEETVWKSGCGGGHQSEHSNSTTESILTFHASINYSSEPKSDRIRSHTWWIAWDNVCKIGCKLTSERANERACESCQHTFYCTWQRRVGKHQYRIHNIAFKIIFSLVRFVVSSWRTSIAHRYYIFAGAESPPRACDDSHLATCAKAWMRPTCIMYLQFYSAKSHPKYSKQTFIIEI